jgi:hypothetical protein
MFVRRLVNARAAAQIIVHQEKQLGCDSLDVDSLSACGLHVRECSRPPHAPVALTRVSSSKDGGVESGHFPGELGTAGEFESTIGRVEGTVGGFEGTTGAVEAAIGALEATIGAVETTIGALEATIGAVEATIGALEGTTEDVEATTGELEGTTRHVEAATRGL